MNKIPKHVIDRFISLGAVRYSSTVGFKKDWLSGKPVKDTHDFLVHFWDSQFREIGYWCVIAPDSPQIFAPNFRKWHEDNIASQEFRNINRTASPPDHGE